MATAAPGPTVLGLAHSQVHTYYISYISSSGHPQVITTELGQGQGTMSGHPLVRVRLMGSRV